MRTGPRNPSLFVFRPGQGWIVATTRMLPVRLGSVMPDDSQRTPRSTRIVKIRKQWFLFISPPIRSKNTFFFEHRRDNQREGPVPRCMEGSTARTTERSTARFTARSKAWPMARPTANNRRFCLRNGFACVPPLSELAHWVPGAGGQDVRIIRWAGWAGPARSLRLEP